MVGSEGIDDAEKVFRQLLSGRCIYIGDKWFGENSSLAEREAYLKAYESRLARNWRRRMRRRAAREVDREEARLAMLPPWRQTAITGRTAVVTMRNGAYMPVDYRTTYGHPVIGPYWLEHNWLTSGLLLMASEGVRQICRSLFLTKSRIRRAVHFTAPTDKWSVRLQAERRKICRRSTTSSCPTATDIRVAWHFSRGSVEKRLRLGQLLMDLECYVCNDLRINWIGRRPKIVGRLPGVRGWIRENCPELVGKYKTLMRYKALAMRIRQESGGEDPLPSPDGCGPIKPDTIQIQPRTRGSNLPRESRFAWESGERRIDATGRIFLTNANYSRATLVPEFVPTSGRGPNGIVLNGCVNRTNENYSMSPTSLVSWT